MEPEPKFVSLDSKLYSYMLQHGSPRDPILDELARETARRYGRVAGMQIAPEQGAFITILARAIGTRTAIEIGSFTGYSAICIARGLTPGGSLLCCDVSEEWTTLAREYWGKAGVNDRITLKLAPALNTLRDLPNEYHFDLAFIDADKTNYRNYYEEILHRTRTGGLILIDNVLWSGEVLNPRNQTEDTRAIRELNDFLATDNRVNMVMLPIADGLTICRKR
jgi:caffeoyl-CoA O-methyltransferase